MKKDYKNINSEDDKILRLAEDIARYRLSKNTTKLTSPDDTKKYVAAALRNLEHEVFSVVFLDNQNGVIAYEEMFRGTINGSSIYPREIAKRSLELNAAAIIVAHNHPSGTTEPSREDVLITKRLVEAMSLLEIRVLDHIIVGAEMLSMADSGLI